MKKNRILMSIICLCIISFLSFCSAIAITYAKYEQSFSNSKVSLQIDLTSAFNTTTAFAVIDSDNTLHIYNKTTDSERTFDEEYALELAEISGTVYSLPTQDSSTFSSYLTQSANITKVVVEDYFAPTSLANFFNGCEAVTEMDLSKLDTRNSTSMYRMFYLCKNLTSEIFDGWTINTTSATTLADMFRGCNGSGFTRVPKTVFTRDEVTEEKPIRTFNFSGMFRGCGYLKSIDLSNLTILSDDAENPVRLHEMFYMCEDVIAITFPEVEITQIYTNTTSKMACGIANMFANCHLLQSVDISFIACDFYSGYGAFTNCYKLKTVIVGEKYVQPKTALTMFIYCSVIKGGNGTTFNSNNPTDRTYARVDTPENPGYFTLAHTHVVSSWTIVDNYVHRANCSSGYGDIVYENHKYVDGVCVCGQKESDLS